MGRLHDEKVDKEVQLIAELVRPPCGICQQPADLYGTVPMCGERPRYPMCFACHEDLDWSGYVEDVRLIDGDDDA